MAAVRVETASSAATEQVRRALSGRRADVWGFLFQLLEDYYPAPSTGFVVCDRDARVLAVGRGVFELTGYREADLIGRDVASAFALSDTSPLELVREWGVRRLGEQLELRTRAGLTKPVLVDLFPAYDDDGGLLVGTNVAIPDDARVRHHAGSAPVGCSRDAATGEAARMTVASSTSARRTR